MRRPTIRFRLTLWYGGMFVLAGVLLLTVNFILVSRGLPVRHNEEMRSAIAGRLGIAPEDLHSEPLPNPGRSASGVSSSTLHYDELFEGIASELRVDTLRQIAVQSVLALLIMTGASIGLGWFMAGRLLRPVHDISATVRRISEDNLEARVALAGPSDELKELADQFDAMLGRLQGAFDTQREFVTHASHELRTPLAIIKTELDVTLGNKEATAEDMKRLADVARRAIDRAQTLIDRLLTLARAGEPLHRQAPIDLAATVRQAIEDRAAEIKALKLRSALDLAPARVRGDPILLESLVANLLDNAIRYNRVGGRLEVSTREKAGQTGLFLLNDGSVVPGDQVERLFDRFTRLETSRSRETGGYGLGLAIVRAVLQGHGGEIRALARTEGGMTMSVTLPRPPGDGDAAGMA